MSVQQNLHLEKIYISAVHTVNNLPWAEILAKQFTSSWDSKLNNLPRAEILS
jgi:hypothetical protein